MECGFWQVLPSIVTTIAAIITAGATYKIMRFTQIQSDVLWDTRFFSLSLRRDLHISILRDRQSITLLFLSP
jgi:hypothetical protein